MPLPNPIHPVKGQPRPALTLLREDGDEFSMLTGGRTQAGRHGILSGKVRMTVERAADDTLYFTWQIVEITGDGRLLHLRIPYPGLFYGEDADVEYFSDSPQSWAPQHASFDGYGVSFSGMSQDESTSPGIPPGSASKVCFIKTQATAWVRSGHLTYFGIAPGSNSGLDSAKGTHSAFVPFQRDDIFTDPSQSADGPVRLIGGIAQGGGGLIFTPGGGFTPVPPPRPDAIAQRLAELANLHQAATAWASPALAETIHREVQQELTALSQLRPDKEAEAS